MLLVNTRVIPKRTRFLAIYFLAIDRRWQCDN